MIGYLSLVETGLEREPVLKWEKGRKGKKMLLFRSGSVSGLPETGFGVELGGN